MSPAITDYDDLSKIVYYQPYYVSPFPVKVNPNYSISLEKLCCEWAINSGGIISENKKYRCIVEHSDVGLFSGICFSNASKRRMEKLLKWGLMLFVTDDYEAIMSEVLQNDTDNNNNNHRSSSNKDNSSSFWKDFHDALDLLANGNTEPNPNWSDFIRGTHQIMKEVYEDFKPHQIKRSTQMMCRYIRGSIEESKWKKNTAITWNEYYRVRMGTIGIDMCMQLIEYSQEITLSDDEFYHPKMAELFHTVSETLFLINDLLTFRKEVAESDFKFSKMKNALSILVMEGKTLQEAVNWIHARIMTCDRLIQQQIADLLQHKNIIVDPETEKRFQKFFIGVRNFIGGYWGHAVTARRYHGSNFCGALPPEGHFQYCKDRTILTPTMEHSKYDWLADIP